MRNFRGRCRISFAGRRSACPQVQPRRRRAVQFYHTAQLLPNNHLGFPVSSKGGNRMSENGLKTFAMHSKDVQQSVMLDAVNNEIESADSAHLLSFEPQSLAPETVARRYLNQMIASPAVPTLTAAAPG